MSDRHTKANVPDLVTDPEDAARLEAENALRQFDLGMDILTDWLETKQPRFRPSVILDLHRVLLTGLSHYSGIYRPADAIIAGSRHSPPAASAVPRHTEDLCDYVNANWSERSAVHLAAYILWRLNWIHAFVDGNGRTARIVSYLVLCARAGHHLPGDLTIPEQISANVKQLYYDGLEAADRALARGKVDLTELEDLLSSCLANQLYDFHSKASGKAEPHGSLSDEAQAVLEEARKGGASERGAVGGPQGDRRTLLAVIERHPALTSLIGTIAAALIAVVVAIFLGK